MKTKKSLFELNGTLTTKHSSSCCVRLVEHNTEPFNYVSISPSIFCRRVRNIVNNFYFCHTHTHTHSSTHPAAVAATTDSGKGCEMSIER